MMNLLSSFRDARVRELVWIMAAPGLFTENAAPGFPVTDDLRRDTLTQAMPQLLALDRRPAPLHTWMTLHNPQRLGRYFETLLKYWLTYLMDGQLVAANLPVKVGNMVIGEYDFLWRDAAGALQHWEAAVKFYLQVEAAAGLTGYIGTLCQDRLDLKFAHLRDKQLKLATTPAGAAVLPHAGEAVCARAFFSGWLFYPKDLKGQIIYAPEISPQHLRGWWLRWHKTAFNTSCGLHWKILPRLEWLTPTIQFSQERLQSGTDFSAALNIHFALSTAPLLVAGLNLTESIWQEVTRGFIVSPAWNL